MTELQVAESARRLAPRTVIPVHDGYVKDFCLDQRCKTFAEHFAKHGVQFEKMSAPGDSVTFQI